MPNWLIPLGIVILGAALGLVILRWLESRNPRTLALAPAPTEPEVPVEEPTARGRATRTRRIVFAIGGAIAGLLLAIGLTQIDIPAFGTAGRPEAKAGATQKPVGRINVADYSIRVIDPSRMDHKKWSATVYSHEVCSSPEIVELVQNDGIIESDIPIEADGRISVSLLPGNYRVGIGDSSGAHDGYLNVTLTSRSDDQRFSYDPATKKCVVDRRAERVTVFSELENPKPVVAVVVATATPAPSAAPAPPRVTTVVPAPVPAATQKPVPSFLFSVSSSPSTGAAPLTTSVGVVVTSATNVTSETWLAWVDCESNGIWDHSGIRMVGRAGVFNCSYPSTGSHIVRVQMLLEEDRSVTGERTTVVVVSPPAIVTTTTTDAIEFDLVVGRYVSSASNPTQLVVTATASNVRGTAVVNGYTTTYSFDCGANGSVEVNSTSGSYTCTFYGSGTHRVGVTAVVRANGSGSTQTKTTTTDWIVQ